MVTRGWSLEKSEEDLLMNTGFLSFKSHENVLKLIAQLWEQT